MSALFKKLVDVLMRHPSIPTTLCRVYEIDVHMNLVKIMFIGINKPVSYTITEVLMDQGILSSLYPLHASWLGFIYQQNRSTLFPVRPEINFNIDDNKSKFKLVSEERNGYIKFVDQETNSMLSEHPYYILTDNTLINNFSSMEAFYIGILAVSKKIPKLKKMGSDKNVKLSLIVDH